MWSLILREEHLLRVFEELGAAQNIGPTKGEVTGR
jgi:hypothetical protein